MDPLTTALLDLVHELRDKAVPIAVGGGFGLYLKRRHLERLAQRTLFTQLPHPRATNDLDLFIRADVVADFDSMKELAEALRRLDYRVVEEAKYMQWKRSIIVDGKPREVKIDLMVGPLGEFRKRVHLKGCRARPIKPMEKIRLHAHTVEEAVHVDEAPVELTIAGRRSGGQLSEATIYVPQPFTYLIMKLFAFGDRKEDANKDLGRHHALDLYHIVAMMTEEEYNEALRLGEVYQRNRQVQTARQIVSTDFRTLQSLGAIRLREHPLFRPDFAAEEFTNVLAEVLRV